MLHKQIKMGWIIGGFALVLHKVTGPSREIKDRICVVLCDVSSGFVRSKKSPIPNSSHSFGPVQISEGVTHWNPHKGTQVTYICQSCMQTPHTPLFLYNPWRPKIAQHLAAYVDPWSLNCLFSPPHNDTLLLAPSTASHLSVFFPSHPLIRPPPTLHCAPRLLSVTQHSVISVIMRVDMKDRCLLKCV